MFTRFLPQTPRFFDFFEQHAQITLQAAVQLQKFMLTDQNEVSEEINPIKILEHEADAVTFQCIDTLHKSFITPFQHNDIFRLISRMDDIVDAIEEISDKCLIFRITSFPPAAKEMAQLLVLATEKLDIAIKGLRDRKQQAPKMREINFQIHEIEDQADKILRKTLGELFDEEKDLRLLIKWKEIYDKLEEAIDSCDDVSNIIEGIIVEYD
jgi:uncharacterized protein Yka (UPF0111/DUF47 family)